MEIEKQISLAVKRAKIEILEDLKEKIDIYYSDCELSLSDKDTTCSKCNKNMFSSIFNMIDRDISKLKGE